MERLGVEYEIADYVEIDKFAVKSFNAIHGTNFEPQDIKEWNKDIAVDLIMHGSPCQDFSTAGLGAGGDKGSGTRSSLMYETLRIVEKLRPKYVIWENVKNLLSKKHRHNFDAYQEAMKKLGYVNHYQVLNARDYGVPQNRERVFTVSIRSDICIENGDTMGKSYFKFPESFPLEKKLKDILETDVDEKYYLSDKALSCFLSDGTGNYPRRDRFLSNINRKNQEIGNTVTTRAGSRPTDNFIKIKNANSKGYDEATEGDSINLQFPSSKTRRGRVGHEVSQTLQTSDSMGVVEPLCKKVCNEVLKKNLVKPNDVIDCTYSSSRLKELENGKIRTQNRSCPDCCNTLKTDSHRMGVCVDNPVCVASRGRKNEDGEFHQKIEPRKDGVTNTLTTVRKDNLLVSNYRIRKLTPLECWRLMGFDDSDFHKAEKVNSNNQLYKQAGNSIVVNVLEAILARLLV